MRLPIRSIRALAAACCLMTAATASAEMLWKGDFSTGDLSQWSKTETMGADRLQVVGDPLGEDRHVLRVKVRQGDDPINASGNRNEVVYRDDVIKEGDERVYRWQSMWPDDYSSEPIWQLFTQWHHFDGGGSPPVEFLTWGDEIQLATVPHGSQEAKTQWTAPLERGRWHEFVFHVNWSANPEKGFVELWHDGVLVLPRTPVATLFPNDSVYLKQGLYRSETVRPEQTMFHTGMVVGTTLDAVWPRSEPVVELPTHELALENDPLLPDEQAPAAANDTPFVVGSGSGCATSASGLMSLLSLVGLVVRRRMR